ncbi:MAG TPA: HIT domain-containing protein [Terriglobia bacterium]|nr:HIT domain-containing protein [Terriglobia bacterium]
MLATTETWFMDYLWSPWRFRYITEGARTNGCPFCEMARHDAARDAEQFILYRARLNFIFLNLYPYSTGHVLITPYAHAATLNELDDETLEEMMLLARRVERTLKTAYTPEGYNLGMNLGKCAGAGVADHLHLHFLPRWSGDTNFMSVVSETRVLPEELRTTYEKLAGHFQEAKSL